MTRRIVSIWFPKLPIDRLARRTRHDWNTGPLAITAETGNRIFIAAVNALAEHEGIQPGLSLADARTLYPGLAVHKADPAADAAFLKYLARWCRQFTPVVVLNSPDGVWLDVTGCARLFRGEANLMAAIDARIAELGVEARLGLADTAGAAWALAHYGTGGTIAPPGKSREYIKDLPVAALRIDAKANATLKRLGLDRIASLLPLPSAAIARRFGAASLTRLRQALGSEPEPLDPLPFRPAFTARMGFPEPIARSDDVKAALEILTARLCERLEREKFGCRRLAFTIHRVDGSTQAITAGTSEAVSRPEHLTFLIEEHLDLLDAGFGIEKVELRMPVVEPRTEVALRLTDAAEPVALPALIDRLGNRIGFDNVLRFAPADTHIPERAFSASAAAWMSAAPNAWPDLPRPVRLLEHPQPLDAMTPETFSLHGRSHQIHHRQGPERIAPEWWWDDPAWRSGPRDYWRIADDDGRLLWVYRTANAPPKPGVSWYLHGVFA